MTFGKWFPFSLSIVVWLSMPAQAAAFGTPANPNSKCTTPNHGTHLINGSPATNARGTAPVVPVYIGTPFCSDNNATCAGNDVYTLNRDFITSLENSHYLNWMATEYGAPTLFGLSSSDFATDPKHSSSPLVPKTIGTSGSLTTGQLQAELAAQVNANGLPNFGTNTFYVVYISSPYSVADPASTKKNPRPPLCQDQGAYGYNTTFSANPGTFHAAIIPDFSNSATLCAKPYKQAPDGNPGHPWFQDMGVIESHEIAEGINGAWNIAFAPSGSQCTQLGDPCNNAFSQTISGVNGTTWFVQSLWSNVANACVSATTPSGATQGAVGDINGDGFADVALAGTGVTPGFPLALGGSYLGFTSQIATVNDAYDTRGATTFNSWAHSSFPLVGDFDGDGLSDIALTGGPGWNTIPVAFSSVSSGQVTLNVTNNTISSQPFGTFADQGPLTPVSGDFNGDGFTDIALAGGSGWDTIPVAFSNGRSGHTATFTATNGGGAGTPEATFEQYIANSNLTRNPGVQLLAGDFNGDGISDLALVGGYNAPPTGQPAGTPWTFIVIATSNGGSSGRFTVSTAPLSDNDFGVWATESLAVAGDFNGDGFTDIALSGGPSWASIPLALSQGSGSGGYATFIVQDNADVCAAPNCATFSTVATQAPVQLLAGDWGSGNGALSLALWGGPGWGTMPITQVNPTPGSAPFFLDSNASFPIQAPGFAASASQARSSPPPSPTQ